MVTVEQAVVQACCSHDDSLMLENTNGIRVCSGQNVRFPVSLLKRLLMWNKKLQSSSATANGLSLCSYPANTFRQLRAISLLHSAIFFSDRFLHDNE